MKIHYRFYLITQKIYSLLCPAFFEMDNAYGERVDFVVVDNDDDKTMIYSQPQVEEELDTECKSPCPLSSEICIPMCA